MASIKWLVSLSLLCWVLCLPGEHTHISATSASASSRASSQASSTSIHGKHHFFFDPKPYVFGDPAMDLSDVAMKMNGDSVVQDRWVEKGAVAYNSRDNEYMVVWRADRDVKGEHEVYGQRLDGDTGYRIGASFRVSHVGQSSTKETDAEDPCIAYNSIENQFLVVWSGDHHHDQRFEIFGQLLAADGKQIGKNDFRISWSTDSQDRGNERDSEEPHVVFLPHSGNYFVVWSADAKDSVGYYQIHGREIRGSDGKLQPAFQLSSSKDGQTSAGSTQHITLTDTASPVLSYNPHSEQVLCVWRASDNQKNVHLYGQVVVPGERKLVMPSAFRVSGRGISQESSASTTRLPYVIEKPAVVYTSYTEPATSSLAVGGSVFHNWLVYWAESEANKKQTYRLYGQRIAGIKAAGKEQGQGVGKDGAGAGAGAGGGSVLLIGDAFDVDHLDDANGESTHVQHPSVGFDFKSQTLLLAYSVHFPRRSELHLRRMNPLTGEVALNVGYVKLASTAAASTYQQSNNNKLVESKAEAPVLPFNDFPVVCFASSPTQRVTPANVDQEFDDMSSPAAIFWTSQQTAQATDDDVSPSQSASLPSLSSSAYAEAENQALVLASHVQIELMDEIYMIPEPKGAREAWNKKQAHKSKDKEDQSKGVRKVDQDSGAIEGSFAEGGSFSADSAAASSRPASSININRGGPDAAASRKTGGKGGEGQEGQEGASLPHEAVLLKELKASFTKPEPMQLAGLGARKGRLMDRSSMVYNPVGEGLRGAGSESESGGEFVVVWRSDKHVQGQHEVYLQRVDAVTGGKVGAEVRVSRVKDNGGSNTDDSDAEEPAIAFNAHTNEYLVVWSADHHEDQQFEIYGQRVSALGELIGTLSFPITQVNTRASTSASTSANQKQGQDENRDAIQPKVVFDPHTRQYLVVCSSDHMAGVAQFGVVGIIVSSLGNVRGQPFAISGAGPAGERIDKAVNPSVAYNSITRSFLVIWQSITHEKELRIHGQFIDLSVSLSDKRTLFTDMKIATTSRSQEPAIAFNDQSGHFLIVWPHDKQVFAQILDLEGYAVGNNFKLSDHSEHDHISEVRDVTIAYNPTAHDYVCVYSANTNSVIGGGEGEWHKEIFARRLDASTGILVSSAPSSLSQFHHSLKQGEFDYNQMDSIFPGIAFGTGKAANRALVVWSGNPCECKLKTSKLVKENILFGSLLHMHTVDIDIKKLGPMNKFYHQYLSQYRHKLQPMPLGEDKHSMVSQSFLVSDTAKNRDQSTAQSDIAYNPVDDEFMVVWRADHDTKGLHDIYAQRITGNTGERIGQVIRVTTIGQVGDAKLSTHQPSITHNSNTNEYMVVYTSDHHEDENFDVYGKRLKADGHTVSRAAGMGQRLTWSSGEGRKSDAEEGIIIYCPGSKPLAGQAGKGVYMLVYTSDVSGVGKYSIHARFIAEDGSMKGQRNFVVSPLKKDDESGAMLKETFTPHAAYDPSTQRILVVYRAETDQGAKLILAQMIDAKSQQLVGDVIEINEGDATGAPAVTVNPSQSHFLIVWPEWREFDYVDSATALEHLQNFVQEAEKSKAGGGASGGFKDGVKLQDSVKKKSTYEVYGQFIDAVGSFMGTNNFQVGYHLAKTSNPRHPVVEYCPNRDEYLVLYAVGELLNDVPTTFDPASQTMNFAATHEHTQIQARRISAKSGVPQGNGMIMVSDINMHGLQVNHDFPALAVGSPVRMQGIDEHGALLQEKRHQQVADRAIAVWTGNRIDKATVSAHATDNTGFIYGAKIALMKNVGLVEQEKTFWWDEHDRLEQQKQKQKQAGAGAGAGASSYAKQYAEDQASYQNYQRVHKDAGGLRNGAEHRQQESASAEAMAATMAYENQFKHHAKQQHEQQQPSSASNKMDSHTIFSDPLEIAGGLAHHTAELDGRHEFARVALNTQTEEFMVVWRADQQKKGEHEVYGSLVEVNAALEHKREYQDIQISHVGEDGDIAADAEDPDIAYNPITNEYLVVWAGDHFDDKQYEIYGQRLKADGTPVGEKDFRISFVILHTEKGAERDAEEPRVLFCPATEGYLVLWTADYSDKVGKYEIHGQLLDKHGKRVTVKSDAPVGTISTGVNGGGSSGDAYDSIRISQGYEKEAGHLLDSLRPDAVYSPKCKCFLVVWVSVIRGKQSRIFGQLFDPIKQKPVHDYDLSISHSSDVGSTVSVAYNTDKDHWLVVWPEHKPATKSYEVFGQFLDLHGKPLVDTPNFRIGDHSQFKGASPHHPTVAYSAATQSYFIVYNVNTTTVGYDQPFSQLFGCRLDAQTGQLLPPGPVALTPAVPAHAAHKQVISAGTPHMAVGHLPSAGGEPASSAVLVTYSGVVYETHRERKIQHQRQKSLIWGILAHLTAFEVEGVQSEHVLPHGDHRVRGEEEVQDSNELSIEVTDPVRLALATGLQQRTVEHTCSAYSSKDQRYLVVWRSDHDEQEEHDIYGVVIDPKLAAPEAVGNHATATPISYAPFRVSDMASDGDRESDAQDPSVAYNPAADLFLVVWSGDHLFDDQYEIFGRYIQMTDSKEGGTAHAMSHTLGQRKGQDFRVSFGSSTYDHRADALFPKVTVNTVTSDFLVIWSADTATVTGQYEVHGQFISSTAGGLVGDPFQISMQGSSDYSLIAISPSVAFNPQKNEFLVVWMGGDSQLSKMQVFAQLIDGSTGQSKHPVAVKISDEGSDCLQPQVVYNGNSQHYLVIWPDCRDEESDNCEIFGQHLDHTGRRLSEQNVRIGYHDDGKYRVHRNPALAFNEKTDDYLVAWTTGVQGQGQEKSEEERRAKRGVSNNARQSVDEIHARRLQTKTGSLYGSESFSVSARGDVHSHAHISADFPSIAFGPDHDALITWTSTHMHSLEVPIMGALVTMKGSVAHERGSDTFIDGVHAASSSSSSKMVGSHAEKEEFFAGRSHSPRMVGDKQTDAHTAGGVTPISGGSSSSPSHFSPSSSRVEKGGDPYYSNSNSHANTNTNTNTNTDDGKSPNVNNHFGQDPLTWRQNVVLIGGIMAVSLICLVATLQCTRLPVVRRLQRSMARARGRRGRGEHVGNIGGGEGDKGVGAGFGYQRGGRNRKQIRTAEGEVYNYDDDGL